MKAAILSIGDELLLGHHPDTNSAWLAARLLERGVPTVEHRTLGDDQAELAEAIRTLALKTDVLLLTGGLGPTADDVTRDALNDAIDPGQRLVLDGPALADLERWFRGRPGGMPQRNRAQAMRPSSMEMIPNPNGTAPGLAGRLGHCLVFSMPGPPREMQPMFRDRVAPALPEPPPDQQIRWGTVECFGIGESSAAERLGDLLERGRNPLVGITAKGGVLTIRAHVAGAVGNADAMLEDTLADIEGRLAPYAYARNGESLPGVVLRLLRESGARMAVAESCTGGLLGASLVDVPGSSDAFEGGWITYSNDAKMRDLQVPAWLIEKHGAVSQEAAAAMAAGAARAAGVDYALSITGVAGPGGGSAEKPVGLVHIGLAGPSAGDDEALRTTVLAFRFPGERRRIREIAARAALQMLRFRLLGVADDRSMLWRVEPLQTSESSAAPPGRPS